MSETDQAESTGAGKNTFFERPFPPGYRDELQALLAERPAEAARHGDSLLVFQLAGLRLALPTRVTAAVAPVLHVARIPHRVGTVLLGLVAFRGEILPCCSLSRLLGLAEGNATSGRTLILEEGAGRRWAAPIDAVLGVRAAHEGRLTSADGQLKAHWLRGSCGDGDADSFDLLNDETLFRQINLATA
jgi:chemotaxis signal transduction protein